MKATGQWITYRTRFLVKAKQLTTSLHFTDVLGRLHSGRKGDYLVESSDGVLRIAPRQIFEDIYVPLMSDALSESAMPESAMPESSRKSPQSVRAPARFVSGHRFSDAATAAKSAPLGAGSASKISCSPPV